MEVKKLFECFMKKSSKIKIKNGLELKKLQRKKVINYFPEENITTPAISDNSHSNRVGRL